VWSYDSFANESFFLAAHQNDFQLIAENQLELMAAAARGGSVALHSQTK
jgi:hypothetical protein